MNQFDISSELNKQQEESPCPLYIQWFVMIVPAIFLVRMVIVDTMRATVVLVVAPLTAVFAFSLLFSLALIPLLLTSLKITPSYYLRNDGVQICSLLSRRTIPYGEIEAATVLPFKPGFSFRLAINTTGYHVGIFQNERFGTVDAVASSKSDQAVVLVLKKGRPLLFTPADPERIAEVIEYKSREKK